MARRVRVEFEGAIYLISASGDRKEAIVRDEEDRATFLMTLGEACGRTGFRVHGFVLLDDRYHLLLETPAPNLSTGMTWLQNALTRRMNARHRQRGHLFGGRYRAVAIEPGAWFRTVLDDIHLCPMHSGSVQNRSSLETHAWSSLKDYLSPEDSRPAWLETKTGFLLAGSEDTEKGRRKYLEALWDRAGRGDVGAAGMDRRQGGTTVQLIRRSIERRGWLLGSPEFRDKLLARIADRAVGNPAAQSKERRNEILRHQGEKQAAAFLKAGLKHFGVDQDELQRTRKNDPRKALIAELIHAKTPVRLDWISASLGMGARSGCCRLIYQMRERLKVDREFKKHRKRIRKAL